MKTSPNGRNWHLNLSSIEIIKHIGVEKEKIKDDIAINVANVIVPIVDRIELNGSTPEYISLLRYYLDNLVSSLARKLLEKTPRLTPREIEICTMIKTGLSNKEIAELLRISYHTVKAHRRTIRKKLGLTSRGINLISYLQGL